MNRIALNELKNLSAVAGENLVSLYLPTHVSGEEGVQDGIRLADMLQHAEDELTTSGLRRPDAKQLLAGLRTAALDPVFWTTRDHGLAMFSGPQGVKVFRLPYKFSESLSINGRYHIKPLVSCIDRGDWYYLLVVSANNLRLYRVTESTIGEVALPGVPKKLAEALNYTSVDRGEQVHSGARGNLGKEGAVFHGQGGIPDEAKSDLIEYFQEVDRALRPVVDGPQVPLVLAGVDSVVPLFRRACSYHNVAVDHLSGNFDRVSEADLHRNSWQLMYSQFDRPRREAMRRVAALVGTGRAAAEVTAVVQAAANGQVETLLVDPRHDVWGRFDPTTNRAYVTESRTKGDEELVNRAMAETLQHAGEVFPADAAQLPDLSPVAAIFRY